MKKLLFLAMFVTVFTACNSDDNNEPFTPQEMEFEVLLWGDYPSSVPPQEVIIYSQDELEDLIGENLNPALQNFDFENYEMIVIFGETEFKFQYYEIINVIEYENEISFNYKHHYHIGTSMFEYQPWIFTKISKSDKLVTFEKEEVLIED